MTLPTSFPRRFPEVRFPYEFTELYNVPLKYFDSPTAGMGIGAPFDGITENTLYHKHKHADELKRVQERVLGNVRRRIYQETGQAQHRKRAVISGGCRSCREPDWSGGAHKGWQDVPTTIEGAEVLAGSAMRGGVMRTEAGAQFLRERLTARVAELDTVSPEVAGVGDANPMGETEPSEDDTAVEKLGEYLDGILDSVATGYFDGGSTSFSRGFLSMLLKIGWRIPANQLVKLQRNVDDTIVELTAALSNKKQTYALTADKKKIVRTMLTVLERARSTIKELVSKSDLSPRERKMVLQNYKPKLKQQLAAQVESQIPGRLLKYQRTDEPLEGEDFVNDGAFERTYRSDTRPAWYVALDAIPGKIRLPRQVAEKILNRV